jgi:hypothetical protein
MRSTDDGGKAMKISSPAFADGSAIPENFTKNGGNASPPLEWAGAPEGTRSFALVVEDPDAPSGMFRHWAVYDLPAERTSLSENEDVSDFGLGANDFGHNRYDGPKPPPGHGVHHYHFRVAALDTDHLENIPDGATAEAVWNAARRHAIDEAELVGTYEA